MSLAWRSRAFTRSPRALRSLTALPSSPRSDSASAFALVLFRLQQLNALAGEGKSRVVSKDGVSRLVAEPLGGRMQLTLYSDGLLLRKGPFRPYGREATRLFIQDILDGYFPYELKDRCVKASSLTQNKANWKHATRSRLNTPLTPPTLAPYAPHSRAL